MNILTDRFAAKPSKGEDFPQFQAITLVPAATGRKVSGNWLAIYPGGAEGAASIRRRHQVIHDQRRAVHRCMELQTSSSFATRSPSAAIALGAGDGFHARSFGQTLRRAMVASPPPPDSPTHNDLMAAVASRRDRIAFASLFNHFAPRIKSYMGRLGTDRGAAEELAQEVMFTVWHRADTFDPSQSSVGTWIFTIARNRRIDMLRRERRPELDPDDPALVPLPDPAADDCLSAAQSERRLREALTLLPKEQADLLQCAFYDDKPHRTIAEEQQLPLGTVKSRIRLALARLRKALEDTV